MLTSTRLAVGLLSFNALVFFLLDRGVVRSTWALPPLINLIEYLSDEIF